MLQEEMQCTSTLDLSLRSIDSLVKGMNIRHNDLYCLEVKAAD